MEQELLVPIVVVGLCTALSIVGVIKKNPKLVRLGLFIVSVVVMAVHFASYLGAQGTTVELLVAGLFLIQGIIAFPKGPEFDESNKLAQSLRLRTALVIFVVNTLAVVHVLTTELSPVIAAFHAVYMLISIKFVMKSYQGS